MINSKKTFIKYKWLTLTCLSGIGMGVLRIITKILACLRAVIGIRDPLRVEAWQTFNRDVRCDDDDDDKY
jgi:hypothetical protein